MRNFFYVFVDVFNGLLVTLHRQNLVESSYHKLLLLSLNFVISHFLLKFRKLRNTFLVQIFEITILCEPSEVFPNSSSVIFIQLEKHVSLSNCNLFRQTCNFCILISLSGIELLHLVIQSCVELFNLLIISLKDFLEVLNSWSIQKFSVHL